MRHVNACENLDEYIRQFRLHTRIKKRILRAQIQQGTNRT